MTRTIHFQNRAMWPTCKTVLVGCLIACVGCGRGDGRVPVSGLVLIDGQPLTHGKVRLFPEGSRSAAGDLDENGRFTLATYTDADGIVPGTHPVKVDAREWVGPRSIKWHAPKKYASHKSGVQVTIDGKTDDVRIELTWDGGKPFVENLGGGANSGE